MRESISVAHNLDDVLIIKFIDGKLQCYCEFYLPCNVVFQTCPSAEKCHELEDTDTSSLSLWNCRLTTY